MLLDSGGQLVDLIGLGFVLALDQERGGNGRDGEGEDGEEGNLHLDRVADGGIKKDLWCVLLLGADEG